MNITMTLTINPLFHILYISSPHQCRRVAHDSLLLFIQVIATSYRHLKYPQTRLVSLMLLTRLGAFSSNDIILHRIIPIVLVATEDVHTSQVRAMAIRSLQVLTGWIDQVDNTLDANIFPQYIFPAVHKIITRETEMSVRIAMSESLIGLINSAKRFLQFSPTNNTATTNDIPTPTNTTTTNTPTAVTAAENSGNNNYEFKLKTLYNQVCYYYQ